MYFSYHQVPESSPEGTVAIVLKILDPDDDDDDDGVRSDDDDDYSLNRSDDGDHSKRSNKLNVILNITSSGNGQGFFQVDSATGG